jgi:PAS domain S-box-containing protein
MEYRFQGRLLRQLSHSIHGSNSAYSKIRYALLLGAMLLAAAASFSADPLPPRPAKVLVLWFGDKDSPALTELESGIRTTMERGLSAPLWIYDESFDESWLSEGSPYAQKMERFLNDKYASRRIDIVVAIGNYPLQYMQQRRKTLLPNAKLMYLSWQSPQPSIPDATGMVWSSDLAPTLEVALAQNPGTHHVLLVAGATVPDRAMGQLFLSTGLKFLQEKHPDVDIRILSPRTLTETLSTLAALPKDTITVFTTYYGDSAGQGFVPGRILSVFSATTNRPMYGWADSLLGRGIVGGRLIDIEAMGAALGNMAVRVVQGEKPGAIPEVRAGFRRNEFDFKQLKRWGIGMDKVPADSIVINREYTFWELYKWRIIGLLLLIVIEAVLIVVLVKLALSQRRHLKQLAYQRELTRLVAQFAAGLINLPAERINAELEKSFQRLLEFFDLDRISLSEFSLGTAQLRLLCYRATPGVEPPPQVIDLRQLPWTSSQVMQGMPMVISHLGQLPDEAGELKESLRARGVQSFLMLPIQRDQKTFAILSFSTVRNEQKWDPDAVQALQTIADTFGSALQRKHAEEAIDASSNRLTGIIESAMDAIIAVDTEQRIVVFNATAERIFGCPMKEALGLPLERFIPQRFRDQHRAHVSRFAETGVTNRAMGAAGVLYALRANGEEFPIEASISQVKTDGYKMFTVIVRDITEREKAERALRETEGRFRLVANTAPVLIWMAGPDKLCTYFNRPWLDFTGRRLEEELGNGWSEGVHPDDIKTCLETYTGAFDRREPFKMEYRLRGRDGQFRWVLDIGVPRVNADGSFAGYIGSCVDLTERKQAEHSLEKSNQLNASILESLINHVAVLESDGTIVAATKPEPELSAITGLNPLDLRVGANYFHLCRTAVEAGDIHAAAALAGVHAICDGKRDYFELEYDYKSGIDQRWFLMSVTPLKTSDGGVVISLHDITERKRHEQAIQELGGRLINAQEQERSRIAGELHDDINQQVAMLAIELQQLERSLPEGLAEGRQKVQALWTKTHVLSTEIQHLSHQLHSAKLQHLGITVALRGLCAEFSEQYKIATDFQFRQVPANLDSNISLSLFRVAQESLHNVAKHSRAKKVRLELVGAGEKIVLRISDDGVGFDSDAPGNQTGIGIVSMSERIRLVGGTLSVCSRPSRGTQVQAAIPLPPRTAAVDRASRFVQTTAKLG